MAGVSSSIDRFDLTMASGASCTVLKRNGVDDFMAACTAAFETYVFTAGTQPYAEPIFDALDPGRHLAGRLYRHDCLPSSGLAGDRMYLKDLSAVARRAGRAESDMARIVLVDNNNVSFLCQPRNGIPVPHFYGQSDDVLSKVLQLLHHLNNSAGDVRPTLHKMFGLETQLSNARTQLLGERFKEVGGMGSFGSIGDSVGGASARL